jgi:hypothetical protein
VTRIDIRKAVAILPRYNTPRGPWTPTGSRCIARAQVLPPKVEKPFRKHAQSMLTDCWGYTVERVDVSGKDVWTLHAALRVKSLEWLLKRNWRWQDWPRSKLPIYIRYRGRLIVWNGTHRMTLGKLAGRKVRARVYDLDAYVRRPKSKKG